MKILPRSQLSIAAINDTISPDLRVEKTLQPTEEAQEARLAQTYQDALKQLQAGNIPEAQVLLQRILRDPIILLAKASQKGTGSECLDANPMLQLRFSTLKNTAEALHKQDPKNFHDALDCYLQAASIDQDDVVLWNRMGTLACALGHLNIARAAFEQGLLCSPGNWLCMEKLAEVLIAIGDEEACHHVVKCLLKISPSHSRAIYIDDVLSGRADARAIFKERGNGNDCLSNLNVLPHGLDLLEPQHFGLSFPRKRHFVEKDEAKGRSKKRRRLSTVEVKLVDISWCDMLIAVLDLLQRDAGTNGERTEVSLAQDNLNAGQVAGNNSTDRPLLNSLVGLIQNRKSESAMGTAAEGGPALSSVKEVPNSEQVRSSSSPPPLNEVTSTSQKSKVSSVAVPLVGDVLASSPPGVGAEVQRTKGERLENISMSAADQDQAKQEMMVENDALKGVESVDEDESPTHERRNFRLERVRTRRSEKPEEAFLDKHKEEDQCEILGQLLEPFISCCGHSAYKCPSDCPPSSGSRHGTSLNLGEGGLSDAGLATEDLPTEEGPVIEEGVAVQQFIAELKVNSGPYHVAHELLEKLSASGCPLGIPISKILLLESLTRQFCWSQRSRQCSLFLAELCLDMFMSSSGGDGTSQPLIDCNFHLCRVVEHVALSADFTVSQGGSSSKERGFELNSVTVGSTGQEGVSTKNTRRRRDGPKRDAAERSYGNPDLNLMPGQPAAGGVVKTSEVQHKVEKVNGSKENDWALWVRYHWLNGRLQMCSGRQEEAYHELKLCSAILDSRVKLVDKLASVRLPHCKWEPVITLAKVQRKLYELHIDQLLNHSASQMVEEAQYSELIGLLVPVLLSDKDKSGYDARKRGNVDSSPEYIGLNILISACEKVNPPNLSLALQCRTQKLEILCGAVSRGSSSGIGVPLRPQGLDGSPSNSDHEQCSSNEVESKLVAEEVKSISNCVACIREKLGKSGEMVPSSFPPSLLQKIQRLLLDLMCHYARVHDAGTPDLTCHRFELQFDSSSFVESLITFCRLQHLDASATLQQQVSLLATVHEVLAVRGLCCAGIGQEGGEGAFLKLAIKHLRTVERRLKLKECQVKVVQSGANGGVMDMDLNSQEQLSEHNDESGDEHLGGDVSRRKPKNPIKTLTDEEVEEIEQKRLDLGLDAVLDQCFYCLYGLNLRGGFEPLNQADGLTEHRNTNCGDYNTKEHCAGVYQYVLPYAKACTRSRLLKLRNVLRAVHKQFPSPPPQILADKPVDPFLDNPDLDEESLSDMVLAGKNIHDIVKSVLELHTSVCDMEETQGCNQADKATVSLDTGFQILATHPVSETSEWKYHSESRSSSSVEFVEPFLGVYENLYHFVSEIEDSSASDKWAGFVLTMEGEEFVEQNAKLLKYDLCYNPLRFESWSKLSTIYEEEMDLMLNDGSKNVNVVDWRKNSRLTQRVETSRRRTRRCLLMTLSLSSTPEKQSEMHELLALVYYESLQNVAPSYDQRGHVPVRDAAWMSLCEKALKHFEGAFMHKPDWTHLFYMGKLYEKLCRPIQEAFDLYKRAVDMKSSAVDPIYRLHASRLKLLCRSDKQDVKTLEIIAQHCYSSSIKEKVVTLLKSVSDCYTPVQSSLVPADPVNSSDLLVEIRRQLFEDCVAVMRMCMEGELKHYHKARFRLAHALYSCIGNQDVDRAKEELAFCFRSSRSLFTINMWEIDGSLRKIRRKAAHSTNLDVQMLESSRKFITCVRKYLLLYLSVCEETGDIYTLERAFYSLRTDKKFSLCLEDLSRLALGKYIRALAMSIAQADVNDTMSQSTLHSLLEKLFNLFMDYGTSWSESLQISLAEAEVISMTEGSIYGYIHCYLNLLENEVKLDTMEAINERIRKRFKSFKTVCLQTSQICKHACLAWGRALCYALVSITPMPQSRQSNQSLTGANTAADQTARLVVDLQEDTFRENCYEKPVLPGVSEEDSFSASSAGKIEQTSTASDSASLISSMKAVPIRQATVENLDRASGLLRSTYVFYRDSLSGPFPGGINLFLLGPLAAGEGSSSSVPGSTPRGSEPLDISTPRKLLLWAFTLVHGRTGSVAEAVKYCEEQAKPRPCKKGS